MFISDERVERRMFVSGGLFQRDEHRCQRLGQTDGGGQCGLRNFQFDGVAVASKVGIYGQNVRFLR